MGTPRKLIVVAAMVTIAILGSAVPGTADITWETANTRQYERPRTWNTSNVTDRISGAHYPQSNTVAVSNNGATNYLHTIIGTDGSGGALDGNNLPSRPAKYPYFGTGAVYGGNEFYHHNDGAYGANPYWDGDCGVFRPHLNTDNFDPYGQAVWFPETLTGANTSLSGGVLTIQDSQLANFNRFEVGDRIQTAGFQPAVFNRTATGAGNNTNDDPLSNGPYWRITSVPAWDTITAVPDGTGLDGASVANIGQATWAGGVATFTSEMGVNSLPKGGDAMFKGYKIGQRITVSGMTPAAWNGDYTVATAPAATPWRFTAAKAVDPGTATGFGTATRVTDGIASHNITNATAVGTTATFTTSAPHGMIVAPTPQTVVVSGMTPAGYNGTWTVASVPTATTFTVTLGSSPAAGTVFGTATITDSVSTAQGSLVRGSDCARLIYTRSDDGGTDWDGGSSGGVAAPCAAGVNCGSPNSFHIASGPTNGGIKTYLSETATGMAQIEAYQNYVFVLFTTTNGGDFTYLADTCSNDPQVVYMRVNNNYGAWNAWSAPIRITPTNQQTAWPAFAVDDFNGNLYVLTTNAANGRAQLYKSTTFGASFTGPTLINTTNNESFSEYIPPGDPLANNPGGNCENAPRNGVGNPQSDSFGYGGIYSPEAKIAAYRDRVGAAWIQNANGSKIVAKVSTDAGVTWTNAACPANPCVQNLAPAGGAGGLCPGWGCGQGGPTQCPYDFSACVDDRLDNRFAVTAGPGSGTNTRIGFAWVNDGGVGKTPAGGRQVIPRGLYYKEWNSTGDWGPDKLVSCMAGTETGVQPTRVGSLTNAGVAINSVTLNAMTGLATYTTAAAHGLAAGERARITGIHTPSASFNGDLTVNTAPTTTTFTVNFGAFVNVTDTTPVVMTNARVQEFTAGHVADPCATASAYGTFGDFAAPALDFYGTSGVGIVWEACPFDNGPVMTPRAQPPCNGIATDPGSQILYKESGNPNVAPPNGGAFSADISDGTGAPNGSYQAVATLCSTGICTDPDMWRVNYGADLEFDNPTGSTTGCTQTGPAALARPETGCNRYVFFVGISGGANPNYNYSYVTFLKKGVQT